MGRMGAEGFAEAVEEGLTDLDTALLWHLQSNHYPPLPNELITTAKRAIELANEGDWDELIELPENITFRDRTTVSVTDTVDTMHLDSFVEYHGDF